MLGSEFALDQFSWQIWRRGSSGFCLVFGPHRPIGCNGEKAPEGMPSLRRSAMSVSGSGESWSSWWKTSSLKGWNGRMEGSNFWLGKHSCKSCRNGKSSSSVINGSAWLLAQAFANLVCRLSFRIRDVHLRRTSLKVSCVLGIVPFAELEFPAPSVIRGPCEKGALAKRDFQSDTSKLKVVAWDTQRSIMSMIAEARVEGYSADRELMKVPSGSLFSRKLKCCSWEHMPARSCILFDVAAIAQVLNQSRPHLHAGRQNSKNIVARNVDRKVPARQENWEVVLFLQNHLVERLLCKA